jgi:hypothetical protein
MILLVEISLGLGLLYFVKGCYPFRRTGGMINFIPLIQTVDDVIKTQQSHSCKIPLDILPSK